VRRDGHYANTFAGIPDGTVNIPVPDAKLPLALPELATVKKNDDEKEQGRVKVSFDWQKNGKTTNVMTMLPVSSSKTMALPLRVIMLLVLLFLSPPFPEAEWNMAPVTSNEDKSVIVMDEKSIGMQAETISIEGKKNITLVSGNESMVFSSEKNIINGSATNIKLEAAKEYDLNTQTGTMKGTNLTVEGTANMTVTGGIVKINS